MNMLEDIGKGASIAKFSQTDIQKAIEILTPICDIYTKSSNPNIKYWERNAELLIAKLIERNPSAESAKELATEHIVTEFSYKHIDGIVSLLQGQTFFCEFLNEEGIFSDKVKRAKRGSYRHFFITKNKHGRNVRRGIDSLSLLKDGNILASVAIGSKIEVCKFVCTNGWLALIAQ